MSSVSYTHLDVYKRQALVPETNEFFARSKYLEGIIHVRENRGKEAAEAFRQILRKAKGGDATTAEFEDMANLALARVFYATRQFPQAIRFYEMCIRDRLSMCERFSHCAITIRSID